MNSTISTVEYHHHHKIESINEPTAINDIVPIHYDSLVAAEDESKFIIEGLKASYDTFRLLLR
jgi:hypothetical protein